MRADLARHAVQEDRLRLEQGERQARARYHDRLRTRPRGGTTCSPRTRRRPRPAPRVRLRREVLETGYPRTDVLFAPDRERGRAAGARPPRPARRQAGRALRADLARRPALPRATGTGWTCGSTSTTPSELLATTTSCSCAGTTRSSTRLTGADGFVRDVSRYPDVNELLLATDVLITDYSSLMFDFANTGRPMLFFTYDLEHYRDALRGFYFDFERMPGPLLRTSARGDRRHPRRRRPACRARLDGTARSSRTSARGTTAARRAVRGRGVQPALSSAGTERSSAAQPGHRVVRVVDPLGGLDAVEEHLVDHRLPERAATGASRAPARSGSQPGTAPDATRRSRPARHSASGRTSGTRSEERRLVEHRVARAAVSPVEQHEAVLASRNVAAVEVAVDEGVGHPVSPTTWAKRSVQLRPSVRSARETAGVEVVGRSADEVQRRRPRRRPRRSPVRRAELDELVDPVHPGRPAVHEHGTIPGSTGSGASYWSSPGTSSSSTRRPSVATRPACARGRGEPAPTPHGRRTGARPSATPRRCSPREAPHRRQVPGRRICTVGRPPASPARRAPRRPRRGRRRSARACVGQSQRVVAQRVKVRGDGSEVAVRREPVDLGEVGALPVSVGGHRPAPRAAAAR